jgi:phospholipid/cholesterol/gamma-HCH transport system permease protein
MRALLIGLGKAPIFAFVIATISCFEGLSVRGTAESVGARTTRSVVLAIFFIIFFNAIISSLLSMYNL